MWYTPSEGDKVKVMALDYGDARTGVAISDSLGLLAGETAVLPSWNHPKLLEDVAELAKARGIETVVLGLPRKRWSWWTSGAPR